MHTLSAPDCDVSIDTRGSVLSDIGTRSLETLHAIDSVLMFGSEYGLSAGCLSTINLVLEHLEGSVLVSTGSRSSSGSTTSINFLGESPFTSSFLELYGSVIMTSSNNSVFRSEDEVEERQVVSLDGLHGGATRADISEVDGAVVSAESDGASRRTPLAGVYPSVGIVEFKDWLTKSDASTEALRSSLVDSLEEGVEHTALEVSRSSDNQAVVGVPVNLENGGLVLLDVLADPPILLLFEIANADELGTRGDGKLVLLRAPLAIGGGAVQTKNHKYGLPFTSLEGPDVSVSVLRARNDSVGLGGPIDRGHDLVVLSKLGFELIRGSRLGIDVNLSVVGAKGDLGAIGVPSVASNARS